MRIADPAEVFGCLALALWAGVALKPAAAFACCALLRQLSSRPQVGLIGAFQAKAHFAHVSSPTSPLLTLLISNMSS